MVWNASDCPLCGVSNLVGPNPPNGIPPTSFATPQGTFGTASAEILPDQMRSFLSGYGPGALYQSMWDTYTVQGSATDPFAITVQMDVSAMMRSVMNTTASGVNVWGLSAPAITLEIGTFNHTTEELHEQWRVTPFNASTEVVLSRSSQFSYTGPFEHSIEGTVSYSRMVSPGEVFDLAFGVSSATGWGEIDLRDTAVIGFDLPQGVYLTSALGATFGVPEPATTWLAATGLVGLLLLQRGTRRRP
jgi:hypothetical protein